MKKIRFLAVMIAGLMLIAACKSQPSAGGDIEEVLQRVYNRYRSDLILDGARSYTVVSGDTLADISRVQYNNGFYFPIIMLASSSVVVDPDKIAPGMELTVPDLQRNLDDSRTRARIKSYLLDIAKIQDDRNRPQDAQGLRNLSDSL